MTMTMWIYRTSPSRKKSHARGDNGITVTLVRKPLSSTIKIISMTATAATNRSIKHELEPALDRPEEIERSLRLVE